MLNTASDASTSERRVRSPSSYVVAFSGFVLSAKNLNAPGSVLYTPDCGLYGNAFTFWLTFANTSFVWSIAYTAPTCGRIPPSVGKEKFGRVTSGAVAA